MLVLDHVCIEYEPDSEIVHLKPNGPIQVSSRDDLETLCSRVRRFMAEHCTNGRCYFMVNITPITIDPAFFRAYGEHIKALLQTYIYPEGIARYGYNITRVTARGGSRGIQTGEPHFFGTEWEAREYLTRLRKYRLDITDCHKCAAAEDESETPESSSFDAAEPRNPYS